MTWHTWLLFMATEVTLCLTPGPAVLFVVSQALQYGSRRSIYANLGILSANAFYFLLSAVGLGAVLLASHELFAMIRYVGAALSHLSRSRHDHGKRSGHLDRPRVQGPSGSGWRLTGARVHAQAANPKALLFYRPAAPIHRSPKWSPSRF
jgi:threonine/homoserine/homoserine lactone efflux protein